MREDWKNAASISWFLDGRVKFGINNMKEQTHPALYSQWWWWWGGVMLWQIFSLHSLCLLVPSEHCLNGTGYVSIVGIAIPLSPRLLPAGYWSLSWNQLRLVSLKWQWVHCTQMASIVTKSQSNRAPVGCRGCGRFSSWIYGWQICWCCVMLSCQYLRGTVLNLCPNKKASSEEVIVIKCLVSIYWKYTVLIRWQYIILLVNKMTSYHLISIIVHALTWPNEKHFSNRNHSGKICLPSGYTRGIIPHARMFQFMVGCSYICICILNNTEHVEDKNILILNAVKQCSFSVVCIQSSRPMCAFPALGPDNPLCVGQLLDIFIDATLQRMKK